jgi:uncharacterized protein
MAGSIVHFEIAGEDPVALGAFYTGLFGWLLTESLPGYLLATTPEGSTDGAISSPPEGEGRALVIYVEVDSIDDTLAAVEAAGGRVDQPRAVIPDMVVYARFVDPAGNIVGLVEAPPV